jgi:hypothetical protein
MSQEVEKAKEEMRKKVNKDSRDVTGACVYNAGSGTYCAVLTQSQCSALGGIFVAGQNCS